MKKQTKKQTKKRTNTTVYERNSSNTYRLDDYRNKRKDTAARSYINPYESSQKVVRTSQNPYRNYYREQEERNDRRESVLQGYEESYTYTNQQSYYSPEAKRAEIKKNNKITRKEAVRKKKRQKKLFIRRLIAVGCIVMFGSYGIIKFVDLMRYPSISYQIVQSGVIDNSKEREGIIVRNEETITSPRQGNIHYIVGEGEKVAKGGEICFVANDEEVSATLQAMVDLDENIYNIQDKRNEFSYFQAEIHQLNLEIQQDMATFYYSKYWENPLELYNLRKQLERVIQNRTSIYINDKSELTEELQSTRTTLQSNLKNHQNTMIAQEAGIVSYAVDGYEGLNFETVEQINYSTYKGALKEAEKLEVSTSAYGGEGQPLYKLIKDDTWKIITYLSAEEAEKYQQGKYYPFYFSDGGKAPIDFKLDTMVEENGQIKCVFSSTEKLTHFLGTRYINFVIGQNKAEGLKIPIKAIVEKNIMPIPNEYVVTEGHDKGVLKQSGETYQFAPINVQYTDETHTYIMQQIDNAQTVQLGQTIKHPDTTEVYTLSQVDPVQGVYVINGSYAKFKRIEIAMTNEEYAILKDSKLTAVKEFDQIISNPQKIKEDQLLKYMDVKNQ